MKTIPSDNKKREKDEWGREAFKQILKKQKNKLLCLASGHSREKVHRVTFLLDKVFPIFHELPQRDHRVVVNVELVVGRPRFHGNQHNPGVQLLLENLGGKNKSHDDAFSV